MPDPERIDPREKVAPVSVVIPVYNGERYLAAAIESVVSQTWPPCEIIVVDDGSTDSTPDVARAFGQVIYSRQDNAGSPAARNRGVSLATQPYLSFLDADDLWTENKIERQLKSLQIELDLAAVTGMVIEFKDDDLGQMVKVSPPATANLLGLMLIRRSAFDCVGLFDSAFAIGDVIDWWARFRDLGLRTATMPETFLMRRIHQSNMGKTSVNPAQDYLKVLRSVVQRRRHVDGK